MGKKDNFVFDLLHHFSIVVATTNITVADDLHCFCTCNVIGNLLI